MSAALHPKPGHAIAAVLTEPRRFEFQELRLPEIGPEDGLLRVEACGLCGTDYEQWQGHLADWGGGMPIIPGHEVIGWIEAVGREAARRWQVKVIWPPGSARTTSGAAVLVASILGTPLRSSQAPSR